MNKRRMLAAAVVAAVFAAPSPALAWGDGPVYIHFYYSDETHSEQVGIYHGDCTWWDGAVEYAWLEGQTSAYSERVIVAYCYGGEWYPI